MADMQTRAAIESASVCGDYKASLCIALQVGAFPAHNQGLAEVRNAALNKTLGDVILLVTNE